MLYDPIRCLWVADTPEERVRQALIAKMLTSLKFPRGLFSVEKRVESKQSLRRFDLLVLLPYQETLTPLLLIECKSTPLTDCMEKQLFGYNATLNAPFMALVNEQREILYWKEGKELKTIHFLPSFDQLKENYLTFFRNRDSKVGLK